MSKDFKLFLGVPFTSIVYIHIHALTIFISQAMCGQYKYPTILTSIKCKKFLWLTLKRKTSETLKIWLCSNLRDWFDIEIFNKLIQEIWKKKHFSGLTLKIKSWKSVSSHRIWFWLSSELSWGKKYDKKIHTLSSHESLSNRFHKSIITSKFSLLL